MNQIAGLNNLYVVEQINQTKTIIFLPFIRLFRLCLKTIQLDML